MSRHLPLDEASLDVLFRNARTRNQWQPTPIPPAQLHALYDLVRMGPTSANSHPGRFVFVASEEGKARLRPHLSSGNVDKTMAAPVCVIVAWDSQFIEHVRRLFPVKDMTGVFTAYPGMLEESARRNATLAGAYMIIAARALGLDCGPMSGFNPKTLDAEFFPDGRWRSEFLCNLGHASEAPIPERFPRLSFDEACRIV